MTTIWKFPIEITDRQHVRMPRNSKVLSAKAQNEGICLWALVDTNEAVAGKDVPVWVHGTGHEVGGAATGGRFVDSVFLHDGALVFHVFVGKDF